MATIRCTARLVLVVLPALAPSTVVVASASDGCVKWAPWDNCVKVIDGDKFQDRTREVGVNSRRAASGETSYGTPRLAAVMSSSVVGICILVVGVSLVVHCITKYMKTRLYPMSEDSQVDNGASSGLASLQNDGHLTAEDLQDLFGIDGSPTVGTAVNGQRSLSLLARLVRGESNETQSIRKGWEIRSDEIEFAKGPKGQRKRLGCGGFGEVFYGRWNGTTPVAVKFVSPNISQQDHVKTLYKEINVLKECRNKNVVQFYGACLSENDVMLVTEYMPMGDLFHVLHGYQGHMCHWNKRGKFIALDIAHGLAYLHSRCIIHCDLKSPNVLLSSSLNAKVADLGMCRFLLKESVAKSCSTGTWNWAAPELLLNDTINEQVDIYSFGVLLWEICTGEMPKRGANRKLRVPEDCSQEVVDLYYRCIQPVPRDRPYAKEVVQELTRIIQLERQASQATATAFNSCSSSSDVDPVERSKCAPSPGASTAPTEKTEQNLCLTEPPLATTRSNSAESLPPDTVPSGASPFDLPGVGPVSGDACGAPCAAPVSAAQSCGDHSPACRVGIQHCESDRPNVSLAAHALAGGLSPLVATVA